MVFKEEAKAVQEIAKASQDGLKTAQMFGSFISRIIGGSLEQGVGIFEDKLKYIRLERAARLECSYRKLQKELGLDEPDKTIPMKHAVPLFQAATLEEDDFLQDLWVALLVKSSYKEYEFNINRSYIDVLEKLSVLDARILMKIYELPIKESRYGVITRLLPEKVEMYDSKNPLPDFSLTEEVTLSLSNLERLGCLSARLTLGGWKEYSVITTNVFGKYLVDSCTFEIKE